MLNLVVYSPEGVVVDATAVQYTVIPGVDGELGIMPGHVPLITLIGSGVLAYGSMQAPTVLAVHYGFAEVLQDTIKVCIKLAEAASKIDLSRAENAKAKSQLKLAELYQDADYDQTSLAKYQAKYDRALSRIQARNTNG